ncbi:TRAP transporter small permease [Roseivivax sediminis]|uniref:TRAP transporter small permease protein n=1 Tax=Roseivivax sediminis TaxID=936889 RepID=A0A1I1Z6L9_9RHOB|nr:TRAP transporter small permease [Roseivivax sediminis]SFE27436.1 TRAP-type C4-dicarboxylate transport system, small permease component [Roseivivax sediminis]
MSAPQTTTGRRAGALRSAFRRITAVLTGVLLLTLTAITLVDVLGRYFFSSPLPGATELTELLVMAIVFAGLPAICLDDGHITVDLFTTRLKGRAEGVQTFLSRLVVAVMLAIVAWQMWEHGARIGSYGSTTTYLRIPLQPAAQAASVLCAVSALIVATLAVLRLPKGRSEEI